METKTLESNKTIVSQFFEYFAKGDTKQVENLWGSNYLFHFPGRPQTLGKEESKQLIKEYSSAFPDLKISIENQIAEGDLVVTQIVAHGTHKGLFQGISATSKKMTVTGIATHKIINNKIVEEWAEFDMLGLMQQIGAIPELETARK